MHAICPSCNHQILGKYCSNCGQKKNVRRITWPSLAEEFVHFFIHIERGFLRTTWQMLWNPGKIIKSYLDGLRKSIQSPISYLVIWAAIFSISRIAIASLLRYKEDVTNNFYISPRAAEFFFNYPTVLTILYNPVRAIVAWFIALRKKLNYPEVLIACFYTYGQFFAYLTIITLVFGLFFKSYIQTSLFPNTMLIVSLIDAFWKNYSIFKAYKIKHKILKICLVISIASFGMVKFLELSSFIIKHLQNH